MNRPLPLSFALLLLTACGGTELDDTELDGPQLETESNLDACAPGKAVFDSWHLWCPEGQCPPQSYATNVWNMRVPAGCDRVEMKMWGSGGGSSAYLPAGKGGGAGYVHFRLRVTPNELFHGWLAG